MKSVKYTVRLKENIAHKLEKTGMSPAGLPTPGLRRSPRTKRKEETAISGTGKMSMWEILPTMTSISTGTHLPFRTMTTADWFRE